MPDLVPLQIRKENFDGTGKLKPVRNKSLSMWCIVWVCEERFLLVKYIMENFQTTTVVLPRNGKSNSINAIKSNML